MKPALLHTLAFCFLLSALCFRASGQYSIDWSTIGGGGGTSTGGVYTVSGTIGQPDASQQAMTGGNYSLVGGFWSLIAVQTPGAPLLSIERTPTNSVIVSWPLPATGFVLERTPTLAGAPIPWAQVPSSQYQTNAPNLFIVEPVPVGNQFYRLRKP